MALFEPRTTAVVDFPFDVKDQRMADVLRRCLGKLTALTVIPLYRPVVATATGTAGSTVTFTSGHMILNLADAGIDEIRLVTYGSSSSTATWIDFYNITTSTSLCQITSLPSSIGLLATNWTRISPANADHQFGVRISLPSAQTCSMSSIDLQMRSLNFRG